MRFPLYLAHINDFDPRRKLEYKGVAAGSGIVRANGAGDRATW